MVIGGAYFLWSWLSTPPPVQSKLDLNRVSAASHGNSSETPAYRELLKEHNAEGESTAQRQNKSFISSISLEQEPVVRPVSAAKPAVPTQSTARQSGSDQGQASGTTGRSEDRRQKALDDLLKRIKPSPSTKERPEGPQIAEVMGGASGMGGEGSKGGGDYQRWSESLPGGARFQTASMNSAGAGGASPVGAPVEIIPPYWRGPGVIDIGVDSDNSTTPVVGSLPTGSYAGAVLKAPEGAKLAGEGVQIHFTEMAFKGVNYKVDAYALQDDTLLANVATEVNHRYMSRIILPALLNGIGGAGQMYAQANTQVVSNGFSTQTVRPGLPDGTAVMGAIAGGTASQAAKVLGEDAARMPATQALVSKGQVVAIQFMRGVYAGDAIAPGQGGEAVRPSVPAQTSRATPTQPTTADEWRAQTQARIEEQRRLQEVK